MASLRTTLFIGMCILCSKVIPLVSAESCSEKFGPNCSRCDAKICIECKVGHCGQTCKDTCIGNCDYDCKIDSCFCRDCADGFYYENCSTPCSETCYFKKNSTPTCDRNTGACKDGCRGRYCSPESKCMKTCNDNCWSCDRDCFCTNCKNYMYGPLCNMSCPRMCLKYDKNPDTEKVLSCDHCLNDRCETRVQCLDGCKNNTDCQQSKANMTTGNSTLSPGLTWLYSTLYLAVIVAKSFGIYLFMKKGITPCAIFGIIRDAVNKQPDIQEAEPLNDRDMDDLWQTLERNGEGVRNSRNVRRQTSTNGYLDIKSYGISTSIRYYISNHALNYSADVHWKSISDQGSQLVVVLSCNKKCNVEKRLREDHCTDGIRVKCTINQDQKTSYRFREFCLEKGREVTTIHYYHFFEWDKGNRSLISFIDKVRKDPKFRSSPSITVLSSERGRPASVFAALDYLLDSFETNGQTPDIQENLQQLCQEKRLFDDKDQLKKVRTYFQLLFPRNNVQFRISSTYKLWTIIIYVCYFLVYILAVIFYIVTPFYL